MGVCVCVWCIGESEHEENSDVFFHSLCALVQGFPIGVGGISPRENSRFHWELEPHIGRLKLVEY